MNFNKKNNIIFLLSHQPNPRFIKQINFLSSSFNIDVVSFHRKELKDLPVESFNKSVKIYQLSQISNLSLATILKRLYQYIKSIRRIRSLFKSKDYKIIIMNNVDMYVLFFLSISFLSKKNITKVIEISDLIYIHEKNNLFSKIFKFIERNIFKKIDKVIFTSPKFYEHYYKKIFKGNYFILENKPLSNMIPKKLNKKKNKKTIIGIVGLLLQMEPYKYLFDLIKDHNDYEVHIHGKGIYEMDIKDYAIQYSNIKYFGEYNFFEDVNKIYSKIDILYMPYSLRIQSINNKLALPNKLYEAMYYSVPIITSNGTYLGQLVEKYKIGKQIEYYNLEELMNSINFISKNKNYFLKNFNKINTNIYLGDNDYKKLKDFLIRK